MMSLRQISPRIINFVLCCVVTLFIVFEIGVRYGSKSNDIIIPGPSLAQKIELKSDDERESLLGKHIFHPKVPIAKPMIVPDDEHMQLMNHAKSISNGPKRTIYPNRVNMGPCPKLFGKVMILVMVMESSYKTHYKVAQDSLMCYLRSADYEFKLLFLETDERVNQMCKHEQFLFKKHCAASVYLKDADWLFVLDADSGVVNPNHCIEEYIDDRVDLVFYERFFNWEIASGNYLAKNTEFARNFLMKWADWEFIQPSNWNGADNGVLQIHILQSVFPGAKAEIKACDQIWHRGTNFETYMAYVTCVKVMLGANRLFPGKLRILRRGHAWVRDGYMTGDSWTDNDFMMHGWKAQKIGQEGWPSPFTKMFNLTECTGEGYAGWNWRKEKRVSVDQVKIQLSNFEKSVGKSFPKEGRVHPYLSEPDVGECYPHCDENT